MQIAYSFDKETIKKIIKGAAIAACGAGALAFLDYLGKVQIDNPYLASGITFIVPVLVNMVKEWMSGIKE